MADDTPITILYDGSDVFNGLAGVQPMPYVTREQQPIRYGDHWGQVSNISINGQITGNATELFSNKDAIVNAFKKDFRSFKVKDGSDIILEVTGVIRGINFADHKHYGLIDYSISLEAYEQHLFQGQWGILNPTDQISYTDNEEGYVDIAHTCSAKGFHTGTSESTYNKSNALKNAKEFVFARRNGWESKVKPVFATTEADFTETSPMLINSSESIDRFEGTYELVDTFRFSKTGLDPVISKQAVSMESGIDQDAITVNIDGEIYAGKSGTMAIARTHLQNLKIYNTANSVVPDSVTLYSVPVNLDIKEDPISNRLTYSASYDNIALFGSDNAYFDYSVNLNTDEVTSVTSATINGTIKGRGNIIHRRKNIESYYLGMTSSNKLSNFLHAAAGGVYSDIVGANHSLNPIPNSVNIKSGNANAEIEISAEFSDEDFLVGFSDVDYTVSTKTAMPIRTVSASARFHENGHYMITSAEAASREETSLSVNMTYDREYYATNIVDSNNKNSNSLYQAGDMKNNKLKTLVTALADEFTPAGIAGGALQDPFAKSTKVNDIRLMEEILNENRETRTMSASYRYAYHGSTLRDERSTKLSTNGRYYNAFMGDKKEVSYKTTKEY
jgi:hypothetical protein